MLYFVTFDEFGATSQPAAVGLDPGLLLADALDHACQLLSEQKQNVTISDGEGRTIAGDDLIACCNGDKTLTPDLQAIPK
jgi:hypothetical protein